MMKRLKMQLLVGTGLIALVLLASALTIIYIASLPRIEARQETIQVAKRYSDMKTLGKFQIFTGKSTYYSLYGKDKKGQEMVVSVGADNSQVYVYKLKEGISVKKAEELAKKSGAKTISASVFGIVDGVPVWQIRSGTTDYNVNFQTGELIS